MESLTSFLFSSPSLPLQQPSPARGSPSLSPSVVFSPIWTSAKRKLRLSPIHASTDSSSAEDFSSIPIRRPSRRSSKKPCLSSLIQEIEPLDVSLIQKDVSPTTVDAMKRTISGMLGLLPSDRFQVSIDALWESLSKLLKPCLSSLIQEIEPLDVSLIQKDVSPTTVDAMKRTISGMLGLLPSDRFQVSIDALWESLSKLLVSSMMTGYTLRNAEYKLFLERNLDIHEEGIENQSPENSGIDTQQILLESTEPIELSGQNDSSKFGNATDDLKDIGVQGLGELSSEVQQYILQLQSRLASVRKELSEAKRKSAALQMQQFVGEEKNDLLDYLRSLRPEKVAELSEFTSPELRHTINSIVHGLLATLSPKMQSKPPPSSENSSTGKLNVEDWTGLVENTSLQFQLHISLTRDYLARLLFWCMLLGHYTRGLEYKLELMELLSLTGNAENNGEQLAT